MSAGRTQDADVPEISKDKARLAASLFGDDRAPSRPASRRTPQKQVPHSSIYGTLCTWAYMHNLEQSQADSFLLICMQLRSASASLKAWC